MVELLGDDLSGQEGTMEVYRDLFIRGSADQLAAVLDEVDRSLADGWSRDRELEGRMRTKVAKTPFCFACAEAADRPAATVFVAEKAPGTLYVSNVVPHGPGQLTYREYNAIVAEFSERFVRPAAHKVGAEVELTATEVGLEHWLSREAAEKLRTFSACANKSSGSAHPLDQQRWMDFIVVAAREQTRLDAMTLRRWLIEVEGWPPEVADGLASEYHFGKDILAFAAGHRLGA
jgi:hypothetical protein